MTDIPQYFALVALLAAGLASIAIWSPRRLLIRVGAVALASLFLPAAWAAMSDLMSRPKPIDFEWWHQAEGEATVLSSQLREGDGVYLWLQISGAVEPRSYRLPWDRKLAEELEKARAEAEKNGTPLRCGCRSSAPTTIGTASSTRCRSRPCPTSRIARTSSRPSTSARARRPEGLERAQPH